MHKFRNRRGLDLDFRCPCVLGTCSLNMSIKHQKELEKLTLLYNLAQNSIFSLNFLERTSIKKKNVFMHESYKIRTCRGPEPRPRFSAPMSPGCPLA